MRALVLAAVAAVSLISVGAANSHGGGTHVGFVSTVSVIEPQVPGLLVRVLGGHERLSVRNFTQRQVVVFGADGATALRLAPGEAGTMVDARIGSTGPPPNSGEFVRNWRIRGEADGEPFAIVGFLGYRAAAGEADAEHEQAERSGTSTWVIVGAAVVGALVLAAALALPLRRREGES